MQRNRRRNALTVLLVPYGERRSVSVRLPVWLVPLLTAVLVTASVASVAFGYRCYSLQRHLDRLLQQQAIEGVRQRDMRATILSQQDEVQGLSTQVEGFKAELLSVRRLSDEIRDILGLPTPASPESAPPIQTPDSSRRSESWGRQVGDEAPRGGHAALRPSTRSMRDAAERGQELVGMRSAVPAEVQALQELRQLVLERVSRIDKGDQGNWETLQRELRLWAAAPHQWPTYPHSISSEFGYREFRGRYEFHHGLDLAVPVGTPVRATKDGLVVRSGWSAGYGWVVEIAHDNGYSTVYAHNSALAARIGDRVKAGDVIALSGSSGNSTGPHVHYEIRLFGTPVDPLRYIDEG